MIEFHYFTPARGGHCPDWSNEVPINNDAHRGFYLSRRNERFLVCDDPDNRFVIVLDHDDYPRFTALDLGDAPLGMAWYEGEMNWNFPDFAGIQCNNPKPGDCLVEEHKLQLFVQSSHGGTYAKTVAYGRDTGGPGPHLFRRWTLVDPWGGVYFFVDN